MAAALRPSMLLACALLLVPHLGCARQTPRPKAVLVAFHPGAFEPGRDAKTSRPVELANESDARTLEAVGQEYVGDIALSDGARPTAEDLAAAAARHGATHYRVVGEQTSTASVLLYHVDQSDWRRLPEELRPAAPSEDVGLLTAPASPRDGIVLMSAGEKPQLGK